MAALVHDQDPVTAGGREAPEGAFRRSLPAHASELRGLRDAVAGWLAHAAPASPNSFGDAVLIVSELFTNAVEAGAREVEMTLYRTGPLLRIVITDDGPDWIPALRAPAVPDTTALRGRGLALTARLGRLVIERFHHRTRVMVTLGA